MNMNERQISESATDATVRKRRAPGPSSRAKIASIVKAARKLFAENGYSETSMEAIAREARVGKATVYSHFTSKEDLFSAVVTLEGELQFTWLSQDRPVSVAKDMHEFGYHVFNLVTAPENTDIIRMISAEAKRFPDLGRIFFEAGPLRLVEMVARYLERADAAGELSIPDPTLAAHQFLSLVAAEVRLAALLGVLEPIDHDAARRSARSGVDLFLKAYRREDAPETAPAELAGAESGESG